MNTSSSLESVPHNDPNPVAIPEFANLAFFEGLSSELLAALRPHTKVSYFNSGDLMLSAGELANRFYVIVSGRVGIDCDLGGEMVRVQEVGPGDAVGFSWCFTPDLLHFSARAIEPVKAIFFYGTLLREDCELDPVLGAELLRRAGSILVRRLEGVIQALREKSGK